MGTGAFKRSVLKGKKSFELLFQKGRLLRGKEINLLVFKDGLSVPSRAAVCVSKKAGRAAVRNRLKRICRESLDDIISGLEEGYCVAFLPRRGFQDLSGSRRKEAVRELLQKAGLLRKSRP